MTSDEKRKSRELYEQYADGASEADVKKIAGKLDSMKLKSVNLFQSLTLLGNKQSWTE